MRSAMAARGSPTPSKARAGSELKTPMMSLEKPSALMYRLKTRLKMANAIDIKIEKARKCRAAGLKAKKTASSQRAWVAIWWIEAPDKSAAPRRAGRRGGGCGDSPASTGPRASGPRRRWVGRQHVAADPWQCRDGVGSLP